MSRPATEKSALKKKEELSKPVTAVRPPQWWGQPYWQLARMHKFPVGSNLVWWPTVWGWLLALPERPDAWTLTKYIVAFMVAGTVLHSAACTINDICDVDFDRQVERCKNRPLVSGAVSIPAAWVFLLAQTGAFLWMLSYAGNETAWWCGAFGVFPLHAFYPLMKRWTNWPQAWLGLAMNWGLPTAWLMAAPQDVKSEAMWVLTFGTFCWTILYDTIYALQDKKDDAQAGVKSTALLFGSYVRPILALFGAAFVATLAYAGVSTGQNELYFTITVAGTAAHVAWQLITLNVNDPSDCFDKFVANGNLGYIVTAGMLASMW
ncbi:UbiA prenyltransferase [Auricularia subglabra TFB-10046 SS5]|nr:UbiA prenyltransferase [Auricularia subglabra TFB-10046 SS5]